MKLKEWYEKLYDKIFSVPFFRAFLKIPGLKKLLEYEMISYLFFGVMTTVVNFAVKALCIALAGEGYSAKVLFRVFGFDFGLVYLIQAVAWIVSVLFSFVGNKVFVFDSRSRSPSVVLRELVAFIGSRIISFLLFEELLFGVVNHILLRVLNSEKAAYWIANVAAGIVVIVFNYVASKLVIFRKKKEEEEEAP